MVAFAASRYRRDLAEDIAQEVLQLLHAKYAHVTELTELMPLALQIARYKIMAGVRTGQRRGEPTAIPVEDLSLPAAGPNPAELAEKKEQLARLKAALLTLGERCRELMRYKLEGRSFPEIQKLFQVPSINTIYTWDLRCRKQLMEKLGGRWEVER
ncbi:MAG: sigma-70 family RNA polymerase sigma factor [Bryobacterales bacterium]|nr:sigma-70 family RNA polymerase sigma factor [Bryobacterales bacterium]